MEFVNSETFASIKELAEIQGQIAAGRAELASLESLKLNHFKVRETETLAVVEQALTMSREAIQEATENKDAIASLLTVLTNSVDDIKEMKLSLSTLIEDYKGATEKTIIVIANKTAEFELVKTQLKQQKALLADDERVLTLNKASLARDRIVVDDTMQMLKTEIKRLKDLKI